MSCRFKILEFSEHSLREFLWPPYLPFHIYLMQALQGGHDICFCCSNAKSPYNLVSVLHFIESTSILGMVSYFFFSFYFKTFFCLWSSKYSIWKTVLNRENIKKMNKNWPCNPLTGNSVFHIFFSSYFCVCKYTKAELRFV